MTRYRWCLLFLKKFQSLFAILAKHATRSHIRKHRQLQDYARRRRGVLKVHERSSHARVTKLFPDEGFGFLKTAEGREIYFHENSVLDAGFSGLKIGAEVRLVEEMGDKGPQATTVTPVSHHDR